MNTRGPNGHLLYVPKDLYNKNYEEVAQKCDDA